MSDPPRPTAPPSPPQDAPVPPSPDKSAPTPLTTPVTAMDTAVASAQPSSSSVVSDRQSSSSSSETKTTEHNTPPNATALLPLKPTEAPLKASGSAITKDAPSATPSTPLSTATSSAKPSVAKAPPKKRIVKTNGGDLWRKAIEKSRAPAPYPKMTVPFNLTTPEVLDYICSFIYGDDLIKLYLTGDKSLQHRLSLALTSLNFVRTFPHYAYSNPVPNAWPKMLHCFANVRHFAMVNTRAEQRKTLKESNFPAPSLASLPRNLRTLKLECAMTSTQFAELKQLWNLDLLHLGPRITTLGGTARLGFDDLPPNLTFLYCSFPIMLPMKIAVHPADDPLTTELRALVPAFEFLRSINLPNDKILGNRFVELLHPDMEELRLPANSSLRPELILNMPTGLKTLVLNFESINCGDYLAGIPQNVDRFELRGSRAVGLTNDAFKRLPKTIRHLRVPKSSLTLELFAGAWPLPNLLSLDIRGDAHGVVLQDLPRKLESLYLNGAFGEDLLQLPPALTSLALPNVSATNEFIRLVPRTLRTLKLPAASALNAGCTWYLPKGLTSLTLGGTFQNEDIARLPRGLTKLILPNCPSLNNACTVGLPRALTRLDIRANTNFTPSCWPSLPIPLQVFCTSPNNTWSTPENCLRSLKTGYESLVRQERAMKDKSLNLVDGWTGGASSSSSGHH